MRYWLGVILKFKQLGVMIIVENEHIKVMSWVAVSPSKIVKLGGDIAPTLRCLPNYWISGLITLFFKRKDKI